VTDELPEAIRAKHPELAIIEEALRAHAEGRPVSAACPRCGGPLTVTDVAATGELVITCPNGHTIFRAHRKSSV
jgi:hypothetical protein